MSDVTFSYSRDAATKEQARQLIATYTAILEEYRKLLFSVRCHWFYQPTLKFFALLGAKTAKDCLKKVKQQDDNLSLKCHELSCSINLMQMYYNAGLFSPVIVIGEHCNRLNLEIQGDLQQR